MNVRDPGTLVLAWVVAPAVAVLVSGCIGLSVGALTSLRLGVLTVPAGFLTGIVIVAAALRFGLLGTEAVFLAVVAAVPGLVTLPRRAREALAGADRGARSLRVALWATGAALAAYAIALAPLVGSGRSGILGYVLNNDPAVHISIVEWLHRHGDAPPHTYSSFESAVSIASGGYPLGGYAWVLLASVLTGLDAFHLWTPMLAVGSAMLALGAFEIVRGLGLPAWLSGPAAVLVASGFLPYSFVAEGGFKEIAVAVSLVAFAGLFARAVAAGLTPVRLVPAFVASAAAVASFSAAAAAWFAPAALVSLVWLAAVLGRRRRIASWRRTSLVLTAMAVAVAIAVPVVASAWHYLLNQRSAFAGADQVGNLLAPVPFWESFNVWLAHDYRYPTPILPALSYVGVGLAGVVALIGAVAAVGRRQPAALVLAAGAAGGTLTIALASASIYYDAKADVIAAPAIGLATVAGLLWVWQRSPRLRIPAGVLAVVLAAGVLASDAMVYAGVWVTPKDRFAALVDAGSRVPGDGPVLVNDREFYAKYLLRGKFPWNSWDDWQRYRGFVWGGIPPASPRNPDFDDYRTSFINRFAWLLERRRPGGSRPPGNYVPVYANTSYRLWRQVGRPPHMHVPTRIGGLSGVARANCRSRPMRALLTAARRGGTLRIALPGPIPLVKLPFAWTGAKVLGPGPGRNIITQRGGRAAVYAQLRAGQPYRVWIQGAFGPGVRLGLGTRQIGEARGDEEIFDGWHLLGEVTVPQRGATFGLFGLPRNWLLAGSTWNNLTGPVAFEPVVAPAPVRELPARDAHSICGKRLDWVELV